MKSRKANEAVKGEEGVKGRKRQDRKAQETKEQNIAEMNLKCRLGVR